MLVALAILAALETAPPAPTVELTRSGGTGAHVSAGPRSLADVAREMREGRRAVGGFSAIETTVPREPLVVPAPVWEEFETRREAEVAPEPHPESAVPYVSGYGGWYGGGWASPPRRRPPHVAHHDRGPGRPVSPSGGAGGGASARGGGGARVPRSAGHSSSVGTSGVLPRR